MRSKHLLAALLAHTAADAIQIGATSELVDWSNRVVKGTESVSFDWLGVTARVSVTGASYVSVVATTTASARGTRLKAYISDQGFSLYPQVQFWVSPLQSNTTVLFAQNGRSSRLVTLENLVAPQYGTGVTTIHSFQTDGKFVQPAALQRRMEFVGDSITAATNVIRPEGAGSCGDGGFQSDYSATFEALLCRHFGASCNTVAVGGKCVMRECGGLQMPDYYPSVMMKDAPAPTFDFKRAPDALVIDLVWPRAQLARHLPSMRTRRPARRAQ